MENAKAALEVLAAQERNDRLEIYAVPISTPKLYQIDLLTSLFDSPSPVALKKRKSVEKYNGFSPIPQLYP